MILNTGLRTDIVAYYSDWFFNRMEEGFLYTRNPLFPSRVTKYLLSPDKVDAIVFCSKNYRPVLGRIGEVCKKFNTLFYYTITAYDKDIEPGVPSVVESIEIAKELSKIVGKERLIWRYDPVLLTPKYTEEAHLAMFDTLASRLSPYVSRCIFTFVEMFIKIRVYMPELIPLTPEQKQTLAGGLARIAAHHRIPLQTCPGNADYSKYGILHEGCTTLDAIGKANGCQFRDVRHNGNRRGCHCITSRDIGWYDSCPAGCKYCNANHNGETVADNCRRHDPASPLLIGHPKPDDTLYIGDQHESLIKTDGKQLSLFEL